MYTQLDPDGASSRYGWQNLTATAQYVAVLDGPHEFLFSVGVDRQFGGTGAGAVQRRGFSGVGATTPSVYFGKGLGDLDIGYLRPLAISGTFGYLIGDKSPRPDVLMPGFAIEYSIPYLESKVRALDLPDLIRGLTPITELFLTTPAGQAHGTTNTALVAPGVSYAGEGWQFGIEAMIPMTRTTGKGLGVTAQFHCRSIIFFRTASAGLFSDRHDQSAVDRHCGARVAVLLPCSGKINTFASSALCAII